VSLGAGGAGALPAPGGSVTPQHPCLQDPEEHWDPGTGAAPTLDGSTEPGVPDGDEQGESDAECPDTPKAGPPADEGSCDSSDDDVEGLRRRQGHEPRPGSPPTASAPHRGTPDAGDEDGLSMSRYLLGALALVALGLLIVSGPVESVVSRDAAAGEQESPLPADGNVKKGVRSGAQPPGAGSPRAPILPLPQDSQQKPPPSDAGDPQSVQSVSLLLDKLAKENQEIRLMQAELQAHKEELHALLQKSEGEAAAAGAQRQSLAMENARLHAALERETAALRDARAELQRLRAAGTLGGPGAGEPVVEQPPGTGAPARGKKAARWEGAW
ncbi:PBIP1 protein, partial [Grus americana]|nr:PBIP1 protein [Grus americana]